MGALSSLHDEEAGQHEEHEDAEEGEEFEDGATIDDGEIDEEAFGANGTYDTRPDIYTSD